MSEDYPVSKDLNSVPVTDLDVVMREISLHRRVLRDITLGRRRDNEKSRERKMKKNEIH